MAEDMGEDIAGGAATADASPLDGDLQSTPIPQTWEEMRELIRKDPDLYRWMQGGVRRETAALHTFKQQAEKDLADGKQLSNQVLDFLASNRLDELKATVDLLSQSLDPEDRVKLQQQVRGETDVKRLEAKIDRYMAKNAPADTEDVTAKQTSELNRLWTTHAVRLQGQATKLGLNYQDIYTRFNAQQHDIDLDRGAEAAMAELADQFEEFMVAEKRRITRAASGTAKVDASRPAAGGGAKDYSRTAVRDIPNDEFEDNFEAIARATVARVRER